MQGAKQGVLERRKAYAAALQSVSPVKQVNVRMGTCKGVQLVPMAKVVNIRRCFEALDSDNTGLCM